MGLAASGARYSAHPGQALRLCASSGGKGAQIPQELER